MASLEQEVAQQSTTRLITDNLDIWTGAIVHKSGTGRGTSQKYSLHGIQKLRELILELAVRGRLVPQDETDEPASVLLERIAEEKAQLVKAGKIKKAKALTAISEDEKAFELPNGWVWSRLGAFVSIVRGITFPASEKNTVPASDRVACLRTANVQDQLEWDDLLYVNNNFVKRNEQYLELGDIVMSMANSRELVGKVSFVSEIPTNKASFGGFLSVIRPYSLNANFLMSVLRVPFTRREIIGSASQTTNIANISLEKLTPLLVAIPPVQEQHRIVAKVDELMRLCDTLEAQTIESISAHQTLVETLLDTLLIDSQGGDSFAENWQRVLDHFDTLFTTTASIDTLKQTILQLAVMGKLVPQDANDEPASKLLEKLEHNRDKWLEETSELNTESKTMIRKLKKLKKSSFPFSLPKSWVSVHLIQLSKMLVDCHNKTAPYINSGIPIIRTTNIKNRTFFENDLKFISDETYAYWSRRCPPETGDIIFTREAPMGEALIIPQDVKWCLGQRTMLIRPMHEYISNKFLLLALTEPNLLARASEHAVGLTVKHLRVGDVENLNLPLPPLEEQHRIVAKVDELLSLCDQLKTRLQQAQETQVQLTDAVVAQIV